MPLPLLQSPHTVTLTDLVRLFHQTQSQWFGHLGDETEIDFGRWQPATGSLLDAFLLPDTTPDQLIAATGALAKKDQTIWQNCSLNPSLPADRINPLIEALTNSGWKLNPRTIFYRQQKMTSPPTEIPDLMIIPARASFRHFTELMDERGNAEQALLHLDDAHVDALLALKNGRAVGCIEVLTSGQVGTLREWYVSPVHQSIGIGRLLLQRAMEICDRAVLKHVMIGIDSTAATARHLCETSGFVPIGQWLNYSRMT